MTLPQTLPEALERAAKSNAGFFYVEEKNQERFQPYHELFQKSLKVAGALYEQGLRRGDRVAIIVPESEGFLTSFFGVSVAGMIPVPIYPPMNLGQLDSYFAHAKHIIKASQSKAILTTNQVRRILGTVQADCPMVRVVLPREEIDGAARGVIERVSPSDLGFIQFTSGSTSQPKGVMLTQENLTANIAALGGESGIQINDEDVGVSWLPLFHDMGLIGMVLSSMYYLRTTALMSPLLFLKRPIEWLRAITRHKGTISFAPNFAYGLCTKRIKESDLKDLDLSSWRIAGCGAEPIQAETLLSFAKKFEAAGFRETSFLPCYGMAEHTLAITFPPLGRKLRVDTVDNKVLAEKKIATPCSPEEEGAARFVNCGRPFPHHEVQIVDDDDRPLAERQVGEIVLRGPSVMKGYDRQEELTRQTLRNGWLHTGDLGYMVDGELYVCGRKKDMIIINGRNYYPQDLEWLVGDIPGVRKGNVVAFGTSAFGDREKIVVVVESKGDVEPEPLSEQVRRRIQEGSGLRVDEVVIVPPGTIPKTSSGKLQRARTKARYEAGELLRSTSPTKLKLLGHLMASQWGYFKVFVNRMMPFKGQQPPQAGARE